MSGWERGVLVCDGGGVKANLHGKGSLKFDVEISMESARRLSPVQYDMSLMKGTAFSMMQFSLRIVVMSPSI